MNSRLPLVAASAALALFTVAGCGSETGSSATTTVIVSTVAAAPSSTSSATPTSATVTVTHGQTATSTSTSTPAATATARQPTPYGFPADSQGTCMTAGYVDRVPINDPGLRTQLGHRTTCGFAERIASLVRADLYKHPYKTSLQYSVYSSSFDRNKEINCTVSGDVAICQVETSSEHVYVSRRGLSG